jgi:outer membrane immunogenic protein
MSYRAGVLRRALHCLGSIVLITILFGATIAKAESGVETYTPFKETPKPSSPKDAAAPRVRDTPNPMSSKDIFTLLDKSLGTKFQDLIVINGGCYTAGFTDAGENSAVGKSGKNVAIMTATAKGCPREESQGSEKGNSFLQGLIRGFSPKPEGGPTGTVSDAFNGGKTRIKADSDADPGNKEDQTPTLTPENGPGTKIQLGKGATSYHAILFAGKPKTCADWKDFYDTYQMLLKSGYPSYAIDSLFGSGERDRGGSPQLLRDDGTEGPTVAEKSETERGCQYEEEVGLDGKHAFVRLRPATHANFKQALTKLKEIADKSPTEQYFIWTGTHNTGSANSVEVSYYVPPRTPTRSGIPTSSIPMLPGAPAQPSETLNGFYVGLNVGGGLGESRWDEEFSSTGNFGVSGTVFGPTVGYNWLTGNFLVGVEADLDYSAIQGNTATNCRAGCQTSNSVLATIRGRLGIPLAHFGPMGSIVLPFLTAGPAYGNVAANVGGFPGESAYHSGWAAGGGVEASIGHGWSGKLEYLRVHLNNGSCSLANCGGNPTIPFDTNILRIGLNFHIPSGPPQQPPPPISRKY